jgi:hypothetical protein
MRVVTMSQRDMDFLSEQMNDVDHKIARLQTALERCEEDLETDGLQASLHSAELERDLVHDLVMRQADRQTDRSLDTLIMQQLDHYRREANRLSQRWQRGQPTPPAYWEAEARQAFLSELLSRYHAFQNERPSQAATPDTDEPAAKPEFPWFDPSARASDESRPDAAALRESVYAALRRSGYPVNHVEVIVQPGEQVIVTGYAHSRAERERILETIVKAAAFRRRWLTSRSSIRPGVLACAPGRRAAVRDSGQLSASPTPDPSPQRGEGRSPIGFRRAFSAGENGSQALKLVPELSAGATP